MKVVLVDHRDSFTWNLAHALGEALGELPEVVESTTLDPEALLADRPDLVVLGPGPGHPANPADAGRSLDLARAALGRVPLFGVCFGLQLLVVVSGGRVVPAIAPMHGKPSPLTHDGTRLFAGLASGVEMMRYHSLVADEGTLPAEWRITARSDRGEVMAIEHVAACTFAVQFHPESIGSPGGARLIENAIELARRGVAARS